MFSIRFSKRMRFKSASGCSKKRVRSVFVTDTFQTPASDSISYLSEDTLFCRLPPQTLSHISAKTLSFADSRLRLYLISQRRHSLLQTPASDSISYLSEDTLFCRLQPQSINLFVKSPNSSMRLSRRKGHQRRTFSLRLRSMSTISVVGSVPASASISP